MIFGVLLEIIWGVIEVGKSSGCGLVESFAVHLVSIMGVTLVVFWETPGRSFCSEIEL